jgi:hypothetical protein
VFHFNDPEQQKEDQYNEQQHFIASFEKSAVSFFVFGVCPGDRDHKGNKKEDGKNDLSFRKHGIFILGT